MKRKSTALLSVLILVVTAMTACGANTPDQTVVESPPVDNTGNGDREAPQNTVEQPADEGTTEEALPEDLDPAHDFVPMPPEREPIEILSSGDRLLEGYFYPAKVPDAPVVVLMHWAGGTMEDWKIIAPWLQNRLDEIILPEGDGWPYHDLSWFPSMPEEASFAVVIFNFGDFANSPYGGSRDSWMWDAVGALNFASSLEGVDPDRIAAIGASIGADGAVDGCSLFNEAGEMGTCIGALSLSPGNYLTTQFSYDDKVTLLDLDGHPVWCLAAEDDGSSPELCRTMGGTLTKSFIFPGNNHGMTLLDEEYLPVDPDLEFNSIQIIQEFLEVVFGQPLNEVTIP